MDLGRPVARHDIRRPSEVFEQDLPQVQEPITGSATDSAETREPAEEQPKG